MGWSDVNRHVTGLWDGFNVMSNILAKRVLLPHVSCDTAVHLTLKQLDCDSLSNQLPELLRPMEACRQYGAIVAGNESLKMPYSARRSTIVSYNLQASLGLSSVCGIE